VLARFAWFLIMPLVGFATPAASEEPKLWEPIDEISGVNFLAIEAALPEFRRLVPMRSVGDYKLSVYEGAAYWMSYFGVKRGLAIVFIDKEAPEDFEGLGDPGRPDYPGYEVYVDLETMKVVGFQRIE